MPGKRVLMSESRYTTGGDKDNSLVRSSEPVGLRSPKPVHARAASFALFAAWLAVIAGSAHGQELEPRQYSNIPTGLNFLFAGYGYSDGSVLFDPSVALENATVETNGPVVGYVRSIAVGGLSAKVDGGVARVCLSGSADFRGEHVSRDVCGVSDARVRLSVNFFGAPAYQLREFANYRQNVVLGASLTLIAPTGQYDSDRLVNIGTNRWATKIEVGMSKAVRNWLFELALANTLYQDNDEFYGGVTRSQDPVVGFQAHLVRTFSSGLWVALDATQYHGGETTTAGRPDPNRLSNARFGLTVSVPVGGSQSIKLHASSGISTRTGSDFDTLAMAWQYRWGGGVDR
jgi:hypothetical protein